MRKLRSFFLHWNASGLFLEQLNKTSMLIHFHTGYSFCFQQTRSCWLRSLAWNTSHVKYPFSATSLFKVWEGWVSSNNSWGLENSRPLYFSHPFTFSSSRFTSFLASYWRNQTESSVLRRTILRPFPRASMKKECTSWIHRMSVWVACVFWFAVFSRATT